MEKKSRSVDGDIGLFGTLVLYLHAYRIDVEPTPAAASIFPAPPPTHIRKLLEQHPASVMTKLGAEKTDGPLMGNRQVHRIQTLAVGRYLSFHEVLFFSFPTA